jgi:hypothetical protein
MADIEFTPVLPQVSTEPKGSDIPCEEIETTTDGQIMLEGETARTTVRIEPEVEVVRQAPEPRISSWSDYGMSRLMRARTRLRRAAHRVQPPGPARPRFGEAKSSMC